MAVRSLEWQTEPTPAPEDARRRERIELVKTFEPENPERFARDRKELETQIDALRKKEALAPKDPLMQRRFRQERLGFEALRAMLLDERLRDRVVRSIEGKASMATTIEDYEDVLRAYQEVVGEAEDAPPEIIPHLHAEDLNQRVSDLLTNQRWYLGREPKTEALHLGKKLLHQTSRRLPEEGRRAEQALIGILRYGPSWYEGRTSDEPAMFVEHTLPREDILGKQNLRERGRRVGKFSGFDVIFQLPGRPISPLDIKTGAIETSGRSVNLVAPELLQAWEAIYNNPSLKDPELTPEHQRHLIDAYRAAVRTLGEQLMPRQRPEDYEALRELLHIGERAPFFGARRAVARERLPYDLSAITFRELRSRWNDLVALNPDLLSAAGREITPSNFNQAREAVARMVTSDPSNEVWEGWVTKAGRLRKAA